MGWYWNKRNIELNRKLYDDNQEVLSKEIKRQYFRIMKTTNAEIVNLYDLINVGGEVLPNELYKYDRLLNLRARIAEELRKLGETEIELMQKQYTDFGEAVAKSISANSSFKIVPTDSIRTIVAETWCSDGKQWSARIWGNQRHLAETLEQGLVDCAQRGASKAELVKTLQKNFGVSFRESERIVRTELAHIQHRTEIEAYRSGNVAFVKTIVAKDERLCPICAAQDNKITLLAEATEGVAFLFHPNCRCDIIPIVEF